MSKHQCKVGEIHTVPVFQLLNASEEKRVDSTSFISARLPKSLSLVCWRAARCFGNIHPPPFPVGRLVSYAGFVTFVRNCRYLKAKSSATAAVGSCTVKTILPCIRESTRYRREHGTAAWGD